MQNFQCQRNKTENTSVGQIWSRLIMKFGTAIFFFVFKRIRRMIEVHVKQEKKKDSWSLKERIRFAVK